MQFQLSCLVQSWRPYLDGKFSVGRMSLNFDPLTSLYMNTTHIHKTATMIGKLRLLEVGLYLTLILLLVLLVRSNFNFGLHLKRLARTALV